MLNAECRRALAIATVHDIEGEHIAVLRVQLHRVEKYDADGHLGRAVERPPD